jgi:HK97 family phage major capsid protein
VTQINTANGRDLPWPNLDDTAAVGELVAENAPATEDDPAFGQVTLEAHLFSSKLVKVPRTLIEDTAIPIQDLLTRAFGIRIGRAQASYLFDGTGTGEPQGISVGVEVGHTTASTQVDTLIYDDFVALEHSVPRVYRSRGHYLLSDDAVRQARLIKDDSNRPIWSSGMREGTPPTINGYGYTIVDELPDLAASAVPIYFGWLGGYVIRDVIPFEFIRLDELFAQSRQVGFLSWARMDAAHVNPVASSDAIKSLQMAAS